jgi:hypothetical protein
MSLSLWRKKHTFHKSRKKKRRERRRVVIDIKRIIPKEICQHTRDYQYLSILLLPKRKQESRESMTDQINKKRIKAVKVYQFETRPEVCRRWHSIAKRMPKKFKNTKNQGYITPEPQKCCRPGISHQTFFPLPHPITVSKPF